MRLIAACILIVSFFPSLAESQSRFDVVEQAIREEKTDIPKDIIRAIAWHESGWRQYNADGSVFVVAGDYGVMQVNIYTVLENKKWDLLKALTSTKYNVRLGVWILESKLDWVVKNRDEKFDRKYKCQGQSDLDVAIRAYNGMTKSSGYLRSIKNILIKKPWVEKLKKRQEMVGV